MNGSHCIWYEISHSFYSNRRCLQATNLSQPASIHSPLFFHHFCLVKYFLNDFYQNNSHLDFKFNTFFFWLNIYKTWKFSYSSYKTENMNINWKFDRMFFFSRSIQNSSCYVEYAHFFTEIRLGQWTRAAHNVNLIRCKKSLRFEFWHAWGVIST